jgi:hypothetical protein
MDGDINYSTYSRSQLEEALTRIDMHAYPRNYAKLVEELRVRPPDAPSKRLPRDMRKWVVWIGWYQLAASLIFVHQLLMSDFSAIISNWRIVLMMLILFGLGSITAVAGFLTVRGHRLGPYFSIASFAAQAVTLTVRGFAYQYAPLLVVHLYWSDAKFGVIGFLGPDSRIRVGEQGPTYIAVDALAIAAIIVLVTYVRRRDAAS